MGSQAIPGAVAATDGFGRTPLLLIWGAMALGAIGLALIAPVNHDESQYLAAAVFNRSRLPFVDYLYLQTPLQPFLAAPIAALTVGYNFIALRIATAVVAMAALWLVFRCQRLLGVEQRPALAFTMLLALTYSFQFGATVVRNDILPALLLGLGQYLALSAMTGGRRGLLWVAAGLAFGAAAAAKISYAVPALAVGVFHGLMMLRHRNRDAFADASACAGGAFIGLLAIAIPYLLAPAAFLYGVFEYGVQAPFHWYSLNGAGYRLGLDWKLIDTADALFRGPAWLALAVVSVAAVKRGKRSDAHLLLDLLIVAGLVAALLPTPTWKQYLIPLLPPLFVRLGLAWRDGVAAGLRWRRILIGAFILTGLVGLAEPVRWASRAMKNKANPITATQEAHWIGERLRLAGVKGEVASLSPQVVIDSGFTLGHRFATGPFVYRSGDLLTDEQQRAFHVVSPRTLDRFLAGRLPAAIVTGYEGRHKSERIDLDSGLRAFALRNGYRMERSPFGSAELFVRPHPPIHR